MSDEKKADGEERKVAEEPQKTGGIDFLTIIGLLVPVIGFTVWLVNLENRIKENTSTLAHEETGLETRVPLTDFATLKDELNQSVESATQIGEIIFWYRMSSDHQIPTGYEICDGQPVMDPKSKFVGKAKPNLINQFVRGVQVSQSGTSGGNDEVNLTFQVETKDQYVKGELGATGNPSVVGFAKADENMTSKGLTRTYGVTSDGKKLHDNRPSWVGVVPLIRIR